MSEKKSEIKEMKLCVSVFKGGGNTTTSELYTRKWVEIINALERRKKACSYPEEIVT